MFLNNKFEKIVITKKGIMLSNKSNKKKEILFSELDKIYITINKIPKIYEVLFVLFSIGIAVFSLLYQQPHIILPISFLIIVAVIKKMNTYKIYRLKICLKNGTFFKKHIPLKLKYESIDLINDVKKELYNYKIPA